MPDELTIMDQAGNILEHWESDPEQGDEVPIPALQRRAQLWQEMPAEFFNWLQKMYLDYGLVKTNDIIRTRSLWTDFGLGNFLFAAESNDEYAPQLGVLRGQAGAILRKAPGKQEPVYLKARAKFTVGTVRLKLTAEGSEPGDAVIAVGMSSSLDGPWTYFYGNQPWRFDPQVALQVYDVETQALTVGDVYYYRIVRQGGDSGDTLNASVLLAGVQTR